MREGFAILKAQRGVLILVVISSFISLFLGVFQILAEPLILSFADAATLGTAETVCACGMLASGLILGIKGLKNHYVRTMFLSFVFMGVFIVGFGLIENMVPICIFGFLFFATLPFANNTLDYLARTNIPDEAQGRVWGVIGFISQLGYVVAYAISGVAADKLGAASGRGVGRGAAYVMMISGVCLALIAVFIIASPEVRKLEFIEENN
jgi:MFS family permease